MSEDRVSQDVARAIERAAGMLAGARRIVVTTGAGVSQESGIPTFRDAPSALWENYDPMELATRDGFQNNPALVWRWYCERRRMIAEARPHPGHHAIAEMEEMFDEFLLVTQNIDNLHREAGSQRIVELHGNIFRFKCFDRDHPVERLPEGDEEPPRCACGSMIRPDVVWFGEVPDLDGINEVLAAIAMCDVVIVVGTSGLVYPAAGFPETAKAAGATVVEVNPEETPITAIAEVSVAARAGVALPPLVAAVRRLSA
jgi:NAD-dependent deacetylase